MKYQVTLFCTSGKYKPVSTLVEWNEPYDKTAIFRKGVKNICIKRLWSKVDLLRYDYTKGKVREYDKEKIKKENAERYEKIKQEKYACGEWKAPKRKERW